MNAASQLPASAGGRMTPGSVISVFGVNFSANLATNTLRIRTRAMSTVVAALHVSSDRGRLDFWLPANLSIGPANFSVIANGWESRPTSITLSHASLGFFSANEKGWGLARADQLSSAGARSRNGMQNSASPGQKLILFATGISLQSLPQIRIGEQAANVVSVKQGKDHEVEVTVQVPANAPEGCFVPLYGKVPDTDVSNVVSIAIHRGGGPCVRGAADLLSGWDGGKTGVFVLARTAFAHGDANRTGDKIEDQVSASFTDVRRSNIFESPLLMTPPLGTCAAYTTTLDANTPGSSSLPGLLMGALAGQPLRAGASISIGNNTMQLQVLSISGAPGLYQRKLSGGIPTGRPKESFSLDAGNFFVSGAGGANVGRFGITLPAPSIFAWAAGSPPAALNRSVPMLVQWSGAASQNTMAISATTVDESSNTAGLVYCLVSANAGRLTIPADLLVHLPAGEAHLTLASWPATSWTTKSPAAPITGVDHVIPLSVFIRSADLADRTATQ